MADDLDFHVISLGDRLDRRDGEQEQLAHYSLEKYSTTDKTESALTTMLACRAMATIA